MALSVGIVLPLLSLNGLVTAMIIPMDPGMTLDSLLRSILLLDSTSSSSAAPPCPDDSPDSPLSSSSSDSTPADPVVAAASAVETTPETLRSTSASESPLDMPATAGVDDGDTLSWLGSTGATLMSVTSGKLEPLKTTLEKVIDCCREIAPGLFGSPSSTITGTPITTLADLTNTAPNSSDVGWWSTWDVSRLAARLNLDIDFSKPSTTYIISLGIAAMTIGVVLLLLQLGRALGVAIWRWISSGGRDRISSRSRDEKTAHLGVTDEDVDGERDEKTDLEQGLLEADEDAIEYNCPPYTTSAD